MSWPRFRLERCRPVGEGLWFLSDEETHHLLAVRHCREGDLVEGLLPGKIILSRLEPHGEGWAARVVEERTVTEEIPEIVLLAGILKGDGFELLLRQVTELGVSRVIPLRCDHSVVRLDGDRTAKKRARWEKIVQEESKQCRSPHVPTVAVPQTVEEALDLSLPSRRFIAALDDEAVPLGALDVPPSLALAVGPEGDWSARERVLFREARFEPVSLGPRILRAFTAAVVVSSWAVLGRLGGRRDDS